MAGPESKRFDDPDEARPFQDKERVEIVNIGDGVVGRATFEPGWKWSEYVVPIAVTDRCQATHVGYVLSDRQVIKTDDGTELEISADDIASIPARHDGWTVGDEPCVVLDFAGHGYVRKAKLKYGAWFTHRGSLVRRDGAPLVSVGSPNQDVGDPLNK